MAAPNIVNVSSIVGKNARLAVGTTATNILSNPLGSNAVLKINTLLLSNVNGQAAASATVRLLDGGNQFFIAYEMFVPAGASLVIISKDSSLYLEEDQSIRINSNLANYIHAICSYETIT